MKWFRQIHCIMFDVEKMFSKPIIMLYIVKRHGQIDRATTLQGITVYFLGVHTFSKKKKLFESCISYWEDCIIPEIYAVAYWLIPKNFMTLGYWPWPKVTRKNGFRQVVFLLRKSVQCFLVSGKPVATSGNPGKAQGSWVPRLNGDAPRIRSMTLCLDWQSQAYRFGVL